MTEIEAEDGGDPENAMVTAVEAEKKEFTRDAIDLWFQESTEWLREAAQRRSALGARKGRVGRATQGLDQIRKSATPPRWENGEWIFAFPHEGAVFQEYGAVPHEIRAKQAEVLAFEWPDAPAEVQEQFDHTEGDLVFFESIQHPGIPAIGYVRYGRDQAQRYLEKQGYETEFYTEGGS